MPGIYIELSFSRRENVPTVGAVCDRARWFRFVRGHRPRLQRARQMRVQSAEFSGQHNKAKHLGRVCGNPFVIVTTFVDIVLHAAGVFPPISYRIVTGIAADCLTAKPAPANRMQHV